MDPENESHLPLEGRGHVVPPEFQPLIEFSEYAGSLLAVTFIRNDTSIQSRSQTGHRVRFSSRGDLFVGHFARVDDAAIWDLVEFDDVTVPVDVGTVEIVLTEDEEEEAKILTANPASPGKNWRYVVPIYVENGEQVIVYSKRVQ